MRRIAAILILTLVAASCGGSSKPWRPEMVSASTTIAQVNAELPFSQITDDAAAESAVEQFCGSPTQPTSEEDLEYVYASLTPLDARARLSGAGVEEATIKQLYEGFDNGMNDLCADAKEVIFSYVPYSGWVDSLKCNISEDFSFTTTTNEIVQASCAG